MTTIHRNNNDWSIVPWVGQDNENPQVVEIDNHGHELQVLERVRPSAGSKSHKVTTSEVDPEFVQTVLKVAAWSATAILAVVSLPYFAAGAIVGLLIPSKSVDQYFADLSKRFETMNSEVKILGGIGALIVGVTFFAYLPVVAGAFAAQQLQAEMTTTGAST